VLFIGTPSVTLTLSVCDRASADLAILQDLISKAQGHGGKMIYFHPMRSMELCQPAQEVLLSWIGETFELTFDSTPSRVTTMMMTVPVTQESVKFTCNYISQMERGEEFFQPMLIDMNALVFVWITRGDCKTAFGFPFGVVVRDTQMYWFCHLWSCGCLLDLCGLGDYRLWRWLRHHVSNATTSTSK